MHNSENTNQNKESKSNAFWKRREFFLAVLVCVAVIFFVVYKNAQSETVYSKSQIFDFGEVSITAYGMEESYFDDMIAEIFQTANFFEETVSLSNPQSELSLLNKSEEYQLSEELEYLIATALEIEETTFGSFNILLSGAVSAWGFLPGEENYLAGEIPSVEYLESIRWQTDTSLVKIENGVLYKPFEVSIDLGGISKGYMADCMLEIMQSYNCDGILSVGGIVVVSGDKNGAGYTVAITNPNGGDYADTYSVSGVAICNTSGNYERYFEVDGEKYCHVIDPSTLSPTTSDVASVTIISESGIKADAYATALMILEEEERESLIQNENLAVYIIFQDGTAYITDNFPV